MVIEDIWLSRFLLKNQEGVKITPRKREEACFRFLYADVPVDKKDGTRGTVHCVFKYHINVISLAPEDPKPKEYFASERYWYETIYPKFLKFQMANGSNTLFNNVPKYRGEVDETGHVLTQRVLILEDVKVRGHVVWPSSHPLPLEYLEIVLETYAKLHATSAAMQHEDSADFDDIRRAVRELEKNRTVDDKRGRYAPVLKKLYQHLNLDRDVNSAKEESEEEKDGFVFLERPKVDSPKRTDPFTEVIVHGDCWSNNFLSKFKDPETKRKPEDLVIVDWQMIQFRSLIYDVSSFLFSYISEADIRHLEALFRFYHAHFCVHLKKMGVCYIGMLYPYDRFMEEWKMFCRDGLDATVYALMKIEEGDRNPDDTLMNNGPLCRKLKRMVDYLKQYNRI